MRVQSGEAGLAQGPGGPCEVVAGRRGGPALRPAGGNSRPRSIAVVWQVARVGREGLERSDIEGHARTLAFTSGAAGAAEAC